MSEQLLKSDFEVYTDARWLDAVASALKGAGLETLNSEEPGGMSRQPLYREIDVKMSADNSGTPGQFPFIRGSSHTPQAFLPWQIAQRFTPDRKGNDNRAILIDLASGTSALVIDLSTGAKLDDTQAAKLLGGVLLDIAPISFLPGYQVEQTQDILNNAWASQKLEKEACKAYLNADPIGTAALNGKAPQNIAFKELFDWASDKQNVTLLCANGQIYHAAGASEGQELGFMIATLVDYLRSGISEGLTAEELASRTTLAIAAEADFFATIAKIRAARLLWAQVFAEFNVKTAAPFVMAETSERCFSTVDPWVNILRATVSTLAAGIGGADLITVAPCTSVSEGDNDLTQRIARNTQIILQEESHIGKVMDPAGGAWFIEKLTRDLATQGWNIFQNIETQGGMAQAVATGYIDKLIAPIRAERQRKIDKRDIALIGASEFPNLDEPPIKARKANGNGDLSEHRVAETIEALRRTAEPVKPKTYLAAIGTAARSTPRINFAANLYAIAGIHGIVGNGGTDIDAIVSDFKKSGAKIACLCGSDGDYDTHAEAIAQALLKAGATHIALAGKQQDIVGIDTYCFAGCDTILFAKTVHKKLGLGE